MSRRGTGVGEQALELGKSQLVSGPCVQLGESRNDDADVQQVAEAVLGSDVPLEGRR
jgi:hypothetical protein